MAKQRFNRRRVLKGTATAGIAGLAGCTGIMNDDNSGSEGTSGDTNTNSGSNGGEFPSKPIELVAWAGRGGGSDTIVRLGYARSIRENDLLPVEVRPINKADPLAEAAMKYVDNQPADGHTVLNVTTNIITVPLARDFGLGYKDFTMLGRMGVEPNVLAIRSDDDRFSTIEELREYGQNNPLTMGITGTGSQTHVISVLLGSKSNIQTRAVQFDGGGSKTQALMSGDIDVAIDKPSAMASQNEEGQIDFILHFSGEKLETFPDVPYVSEVFDFEIEVAQQRGAVVHGDTPDEKVEHLRGVWKEIYETDEFKSYAENNQVLPTWLPGDEYRGLLESMEQNFTQVYKENNLGIYSN